MSDGKYYFDFDMGFPAAKAGDTIQVKFFYSLFGYVLEDFRVKTTSNGFCILNELDACYAFLEMWDTAPVLTDVLNVRVIKPPDSLSLLCFEIQNTKTGEVYKTPAKRLWKKGGYSKYVENLNQKIQFDSPTSVFPTSETTAPAEKGFNFFLVVPLFIAVLGFVLYKMIKSHNAHS